MWSRHRVHVTLSKKVFPGLQLYNLVETNRDLLNRGSALYCKCERVPAAAASLLLPVWGLSQCSFITIYFCGQEMVVVFFFFFVLNPPGL